MSIFKGKTEDFAGIRLDKFLTSKFADFSRTKIQGMIKSGTVRVNGSKSKSSYTLNKFDLVEVDKVLDAVVDDIEYEDIDLPIIYEDKEVLVVSKPFGMVVHPSDTGSKQGTVVNAVLNKLKKGVGQEGRPGIVHRLDKDTSGVLVVAKTSQAYNHLVSQFKLREVGKKYVALVKGKLDYKKGKIDSPISRDLKSRKKMAVASRTEGKEAITFYEVLEEFEFTKGKHVSLVEVEIKTGRTHQIRVHMAAIGYPVVGDNVYGVSSFNRSFCESFDLKRHFLHAKKLSIVLPGKKKKSEFSAPLPLDLKVVLNELRDI